MINGIKTRIEVRIFFYSVSFPYARCICVPAHISKGGQTKCIHDFFMIFSVHIVYFKCVIRKFVDVVFPLFQKFAIKSNRAEQLLIVFGNYGRFLGGWKWAQNYFTINIHCTSVAINFRLLHKMYSQSRRMFNAISKICMVPRIPLPLLNTFQLYMCGSCFFFSKEEPTEEISRQVFSFFARTKQRNFCRFQIETERVKCYHSCK